MELCSHGRGNSSTKIRPKSDSQGPRGQQLSKQRLPPPFMKASKIIALIIIAFAAAAALALASDETAPSVMPDAALSKLKEGNLRFSGNDVSQGKPNAAKRAETQNGQHPFAIVLTCADSRTSPEMIFDSNIGDLFVVRTAGNVVDEHALGSIEYAVDHLGARLVVVLGHESCGAVTAALASDTAPSHASR